MSLPVSFRREPRKGFSQKIEEPKNGFSKERIHFGFSKKIHKWVSFLMENPKIGLPPKRTHFGFSKKSRNEFSLENPKMSLSVGFLKRTHFGFSKKPINGFSREETQFLSSLWRIDEERKYEKLEKKGSNHHSFLAQLNYVYLE